MNMGMKGMNVFVCARVLEKAAKKISKNLQKVIDYIENKNGLLLITMDYKWFLFFENNQFIELKIHYVV